MTDPEGYQQEPVVIPIVANLVRQLLIDQTRNHKLTPLLVKPENIVAHHEGTWEELPSIYISEVSMVPVLSEENIPGGIGSTWNTTVQLHLITSDDSFCNYPPHEAGETDTGDTKFEGAELVLIVLKQIVFRIIAENRRGYESDDIPTFQWDQAILEGGELIDGGYDGVKDMWAYIMSYTFECEAVSR